jgi:outer membrane protein
MSQPAPPSPIAPACPPLRRALAAALACLALHAPASAQDLALPAYPVHIPNFAGIGIGSYPKYLGSDENAVGAAPFVHMSWGDRFATLAVNYLTVNLVEHPNWLGGPIGVLRFGRRDVDNSVIAKLPEIDPSLSLGGFVGYAIRSDNEIRDRWSFRADISQDVIDSDGGYIAGLAVTRWLPVGRFSMLGLFANVSYGSSNYMDTYFSVNARDSAASGLPEFDAKAGARSVQAAAVFVQPLSKTWFLSGGALYGHLLGDVADSPIVADEGSVDQLVFGIGLGRAF